jgi:predicted RNase H-like nuclease (RuvC/YqgF family)
MKTREQIESLKREWSNDPEWDIADTEGFEDHKEELEAYQKQYEIEVEQRHIARLNKKATALGIPGNLTLTKYIMNLEDQIEQLEERLEQIENLDIWRSKK